MRASLRPPAFTLLELAVVIAITAILASMVIPRFGNAAVRQRADAAARRVIDDLEFARRLAKRTGTSQKVSFDEDADDYSVKGFPDPDRPASEYVVSLANAPYNVLIASADFAGGTELEFDGFGIPVGLGNTPGEVVLQAGVEIRTIKVDPDTGEAYVE